MVDIHTEEYAVLPKVLPVAVCAPLIGHILQLILLGFYAFITPFKGIIHGQPVQAVLKNVSPAHIKLESDNFKNGVDGLPQVRGLVQCLEHIVDYLVCHKITAVFRINHSAVRKSSLYVFSAVRRP